MSDRTGHAVTAAPSRARSGASGSRRIVGMLTILLLLVGYGEAGAWPWSKKKELTPVPDAPEALWPALREAQEGRWEEALKGFWAYTAERESHEEGHALATFHMAEAARALGLRQLATEYHAELVRTSLDQDIALRSLGVLEAITREEVFDERTIVEELLYEKEYGTLPTRLNNFVNYQQARMDYRHGYPRWATYHLERIEGEDDYFFRAKVLRALWALKQDDVKRCRRLLEEVASTDGIDTAVRNEAKKALARVLYEQGEFLEAYRLYREIEAPELTMSDVILEEAWAKYREGDYRKAMGRLVAFTAPSFRELFKPEQYLLKSLIYMQFCHYRAAQDVIGEFRGRYGDVLQCIRSRGDISANAQAAGILEGTEAIVRLDRYQDRLEAEQTRLEAMMLPEAMGKALLPVYTLKRAQVARSRDRAWKREVDHLKQILFDHDEQVNLLAYEAGMDQYRKVKLMYHRDEAEETAAEEPEIPKFSRNTYYTFDGEYWNDELDDYTFFIEDYCRDPERWDGGSPKM